MIIGITGGVGTGKSTVLNYIKDKYQAYIILTDELGHEVMNVGMDAYKKIVEAFGDCIFNEDKSIDRNALASIVYASTDKLNLLNSIVHPAVKNRLKELIDENSDKKIVMVESAILFETSLNTICDCVVGVITNTEIRIERLIDSRGYSRQKALDIIDKQLSDEELKSKCDYVIYNNADEQKLFKQIDDFILDIV